MLVVRAVLVMAASENGLLSRFRFGFRCAGVGVDVIVVCKFDGIFALLCPDPSLWYERRSTGGGKTSFGSIVVVQQDNENMMFGSLLRCLLFDSFTERFSEKGSFPVTAMSGPGTSCHLFGRVSFLARLSM